MKSLNSRTSLVNVVWPGCKLGKLPFVLLLVTVAAVLFPGGCVAYAHATLSIVVDTEGYRGHHGYYARPHPQYYCYDCHGYSYFDPYYDYCVYYGFRFRWDSYPSMRRYYREHYPVIVKRTPHYGEYEYKPDYRRDSRYGKPPDYETWKKSEGRTFYKGKESSGEKTSGKTSSRAKSSHGR
jgi:hypothetical protein